MGEKLNFIFGLSSLIGLIITAVVTIFAILDGNYGTQANIVIFSLAAINLALATVCVLVVIRTESLSQKNSTLQPIIDFQKTKITALLSKIECKDNNFSEVADILHSIQDQLRDRNFELSNAHLGIELGEEFCDSEMIRLEKTNEMFYLFVVDNIKNIFDMMSGDKCAVSLKILDISDSPKNDTIMVRTFIRDSTSYRERKSSDKSIFEYPYYENTAFNLVLSSKYPNNYYASDNLGNESTYVNSNSNWKKFYNSTLVCPIRMELIEEEETPFTDYSVLGFICIDNMKGGLNNKACIQLLASISDSLFNNFLIYNSMGNMIGEDEDMQSEIESGEVI